MTMGALVPFHDKQLALIRKTVAKDCDAAEFDWAIEICKGLRLDPLRRQIYFFVFHKDKPDKRQMIPVVAIGGYRSIAERTGTYRPGRTHTVIDDKLIDAATNPRGISHAEATVYKHMHGEWHEIVETAYWDEFAPLKEVWGEDRRPTGKFVLDPKKEGWHRMPRVMIEKCAEAKALRRGWPDDFAGTYAEGEIDRAEALELTPSELADTADRTDRMAKLGGPNAIMIQWEPNAPLERIQVGRFGDQALAFIAENMKRGDEEPGAIMEWAERNRHSINEYWAHDKDGALMLKAELEKVKAFSSQPMAAE